MDLEQFDCADMTFASYVNGVFHYRGNHEGFQMEAEFQPNPEKRDAMTLKAVENFGDLGWTRLNIRDASGKIVYASEDE